jgi:hypothetical protein
MEPLHFASLAVALLIFVVGPIAGVAFLAWAARQSQRR